MDWQIVEAIFIITFVKIPGWLFHHKIFLVIGMIAVVALFVVPRACNTTPKTQPISIEQQNAPDITLAPYVLATTSRFYYVQSYTQVSDFEIKMQKWYEYDTKKKNWTLRTIPLSITKEAYGDFRFYKR
jgi:hypothetical protein